MVSQVELESFCGPKSGNTGSEESLGASLGLLPRTGAFRLTCTCNVSPHTTCFSFVCASHPNDPVEHSYASATIVIFNGFASRRNFGALKRTYRGETLATQVVCARTTL